MHAATNSGAMHLSTLKESWGYKSFARRNLLKSKDFNRFLTFLTIKVTDMTLVEIKSTTITEKGQICIPGSMRRSKQFGKGSRIAILSFNDHIELRPMDQISRKMETAIASENTLAKDWNSTEDEEAWKNL